MSFPCALMAIPFEIHTPPVEDLQKLVYGGV